MSTCAMSVPLASAEMETTRMLDASVRTRVHVSPWSAERQTPCSSVIDLPYVMPLPSTASVS